MPDIHALVRTGQKEERTEREVERFQERERENGEGQRGGEKRCLNECTEAPRGPERQTYQTR